MRLFNQAANILQNWYQTCHVYDFGWVNSIKFPFTILWTYLLRYKRFYMNEKSCIFHVSMSKKVTKQIYTIAKAKWEALLNGSKAIVLSYKVNSYKLTLIQCVQHLSILLNSSHFVSVLLDLSRFVSTYLNFSHVISSFLI